MKHFAAALVSVMALAALPPAAAAQPETTDAAEPAGRAQPATDRLLWCASAFYWLAGSAEDSGDHEEAELYDRWSKSLLERARAALAEAGVTPAAVEALVAGSDAAALEELGTDAARYDVMTCPELVEPPTGPQP